VKEDGLTHPDCWTKNVSVEHAKKALGVIGENPRAPRYELVHCWRVPVAGHNLSELWARVESDLTEWHDLVARYDDEVDEGGLMDLEDLRGLCELLSYWDPDGDAFRYPSALNGTWNSRLPFVNLKTLCELAGHLDATTIAYASFLGEGYQFSTFGSPGPNTGSLY
jgi:hypothetical protein